VARAVARSLGFRVLDPGAASRAIAWLILERGGSTDDEPTVIAALEGLDVDVTVDACGGVSVTGRTAVPPNDTSPWMLYAGTVAASTSARFSSPSSTSPRMAFVNNLSRRRRMTGDSVVAAPVRRRRKFERVASAGGEGALFGSQALRGTPTRGVRASSSSCEQLTVELRSRSWRMLIGLGMIVFEPF
jgi:hypothetical protein